MVTPNVKKNYSKESNDNIYLIILQGKIFQRRARYLKIFLIFDSMPASFRPLSFVSTGSSIILAIEFF